MKYHESIVSIETKDVALLIKAVTLAAPILTNLLTRAEFSSPILQKAVEVNLEALDAIHYETK